MLVTPDGGLRHYSLRFQVEVARTDAKLIYQEPVRAVYNNWHPWDNSTHFSSQFQNSYSMNISTQKGLLN